MQVFLTFILVSQLHLGFTCSHGYGRYIVISLRLCHVYVQILINGNIYSIIDIYPLKSLCTLFKAMIEQLFSQTVFCTFTK